MAEHRTFAPSPQEEAWGVYVTGLASVEEPMGPAPSGWRLLYLVRGEAMLSLPGHRRQRLEAGDAVLMDERQGTLLSPDPRRNCRIHCVDFGGAWAGHWVRTGILGGLPKVFRPGFDEHLLNGVVRLWELARNAPEGAGLSMAGTLADLLARLEVSRHCGQGAARPHRMVQQAQRLLSDPAGDHLVLEAAAEKLGVSYSWFRRSFRTQTGLPPQRFRMLRRLDRACLLLLDSSLTIAQVAVELGFSSQAYFARAFRKETGFSPSVWRRLRRPGAEAPRD